MAPEPTQQSERHQDIESGGSPDPKPNEASADPEEGAQDPSSKRARKRWVWAIIILLCAGGLAGGLAGHFVANKSSTNSTSSNPSPPTESTNNQTGTFNTTNAKTATAQSAFTSFVPFTLPFTSPPDILLGLQKLDLKKGASTLGIDTHASNITARGFTIHASTTRDTTINEAVLQWMAVPRTTPAWTTDYQSGHFGTLSARDRSDTGHVLNVGDVKFAHPYTSPPRVVVWIHAFDFDAGRGWRLHAYPSNIRGAGFTVNVNTWSNTLLYSANVSWVAWPAGDSSVVGNYWRPNMTRLVNATDKAAAGFGNTSFVSFAQGERRRTFPEPLAGFSRFDVHHNTGEMKIVLENGVRERGMETTVRSFGNVSVGNNFEIAWLAAT